MQDNAQGNQTSVPVRERARARRTATQSRLKVNEVGISQGCRSHKGRTEREQSDNVEQANALELRDENGSGSGVSTTNGRKIN